MKKTFLTVFLSITTFASFCGLLTAQTVTNGVEPTVTIYAVDPDASETGPDPGSFLVRRSGGTNSNLLVFYNLSGTASNGVDYQTLSNTTVTIPIGAYSAAIRVVPIDDSLVEGTETIVVQIVPSPLASILPQYRIGYPSNAVVNISDNDQLQTNQPPFVRLNAPQDGDIFAAPTDIRLNAYAQDLEDGFDLQVEFFAGTKSLGLGTFVPTLCPSPYCPSFALVWSNAPPGQYAITAVATDKKGLSSTSNPARIWVQGGTNQSVVNIFTTDPVATEIPPWLDIPEDPAVFTVQRSGPTNFAMSVFYSITGSASNGVDYDKLSGTVSIPEGSYSAPIFVDAIYDMLAEGTETVVLTIQPPVCVAIFPPPPGCYLVGPSNRAIAFIRDFQTGDSNLPPTVKITAPVNGATYRAPATVQIEAATVDRDGYAPKIELFANNLKIWEEEIVFIQAPPPGQPIYFSFVWSNVTAGDYALTARTTDNQGATGLSEPVKISVFGTNAPPGTNEPVVTIVALDSIAVEGQSCWSNWWWTTTVSDTGWTTTNSTVFRTNSCSGTNTALFAIRRSGPTNSDLTVFYSIGGTASNGIDYISLPGNLTIPAGHRAARIELVPIDDAIPERIETVLLSLQPSPVLTPNASTYAIGVPGRAAAIILDNDQPRPATMRLSDGMFHLCLPGTNGYSFRVRSSTDFANWSALCTNIVSEGAIHFVDPDATSSDQEFYEITPVPLYAPQD